MSKISITSSSRLSTFWFVRAPLAIGGGVVVGQICQVFVALLLDLIWHANVTGGRWEFNFPNIVLIVLVGILSGFTAGWIAGKRGKSLGAAVIYVPFFLFLVVSIAINLDFTNYSEQAFDTKPALWVWLALAPGIIGGHYGALNGRWYFNRAAQICSIGLIVVSYVGFSIFHLFTTFIAFKIVGFMGAIVTFSAPLFAELYWGRRIWNESGYFLNYFTLLFLALLVLRTIGVIASIASHVSQVTGPSSSGK